MHEGARVFPLVQNPATFIARIAVIQSCSLCLLLCRQIMWNWLGNWIESTNLLATDLIRLFSILVLRGPVNSSFVVTGNYWHLRTSGRLSQCSVTYFTCFAVKPMPLSRDVLISTPL